MIFFNKWKKRAFDMLSDNERQKKEIASLKSDLDTCECLFIKLCELNIIERIMQLRIEFAEKKGEYPKCLYVPVNVWDEIRSKINFKYYGNASDLDLFMGMKVKVTIDELRVA